MKSFVLRAAAPALLLGGCALLSSDASAEDRAALGIVMNDQSAGRSGIEITTVINGSPAAAARLWPGDRIMAVNGQRVYEYPEVIRIVGSCPPGSLLSLDVQRGPFLMTRHAQLGLHEQVFPGRPTFEAAKSAPGVPAAPWYRPFAPRPSNPNRDRVMDSLYNSDFSRRSFRLMIEISERRPRPHSREQSSSRQSFHR